MRFLNLATVVIAVACGASETTTPAQAPLSSTPVETAQNQAATGAQQRQAQMMADANARAQAALEAKQRADAFAQQQAAAMDEDRRKAAEAKQQADALAQQQAATADEARRKQAEDEAHHPEWQVCAGIQAKAGFESQLAAEKSNPSGVVDLKRMHQLGEWIQGATQKIAEDKARFLKERGRPFTMKDCETKTP